MTQSEGEETEMRPPEQGVEESGRPFLFTAEDLPALLEAGVFERIDDRIELEDGRIVVVAPESTAHMRAVRLLVHRLQSEVVRLGLEGRFAVQPGGTVRLNERTVYDPDACVIVPEVKGFYLAPSEVLLVIEAAISSRSRDLGRKKKAYAAAGFPEYWVLDGAKTKLHVFSDPTSDGWSSEVSFGPEDTVSPLFAPEIILAVKDLF